MSELPDTQLLYWATNQWIKYSGEVVFRSQTSSAPLKIKFENAYCVNLLHTISSSRGMSVNLTISPEKIDVNGVLLDNNWIK